MCLILIPNLRFTGSTEAVQQDVCQADPGKVSVTLVDVDLKFGGGPDFKWEDRKYS
jgi:hypothetical protein